MRNLRTTTRMMPTTTNNALHVRFPAALLAARLRCLTARCLLLAVLCAAVAPCLSAESKDPTKNPRAPYALIEGTVWDGTTPVYGAKVRIRRTDAKKKPHWDLTSDHRGEFARRVAAGKADYVVSAEVEGEKGGKHPLTAEVAIHVEADERVDASLHLH